MKIKLIFLVSIFTWKMAFSQSERLPSPEKNIKILSWNIYMLPGIVPGKNKTERARAIGDVLQDSEYDVIVFQEAFHRKARKHIAKALQENFPYQSGPANRKFLSLKVNSGVWIFSKHPIIYSRAITFKSRSGIDAFSRKGALLTEIKIKDRMVQIAGTHLQNANPDWVKHSQCVELYHRLLKPHLKEGVPQIICGDFNINRMEEENYRFMLDNLNATDGELSGENHFSYDRSLNDLKVEPGDNRDLIDYILVRNADQINFLQRKIITIRRQWSPLHADLSDHFAIEAEIRFGYPLITKSTRP